MLRLNLIYIPGQAQYFRRRIGGKKKKKRNIINGIWRKEVETGNKPDYWKTIYWSSIGSTNDSFSFTGVIKMKGWWTYWTFDNLFLLGTFVRMNLRQSISLLALLRDEFLGNVKTALLLTFDAFIVYFSLSERRLLRIKITIIFCCTKLFIFIYDIYLIF